MYVLHSWLKPFQKCFHRLRSFSQSLENQWKHQPELLKPNTKAPNSKSSYPFKSPKAQKTCQLLKKIPTRTPPLQQLPPKPPASVADAFQVLSREKTYSGEFTGRGLGHPWLGPSARLVRWFLSPFSDGKWFFQKDRYILNKRIAGKNQ